jgi:hypothetical protein
MRNVTRRQAVGVVVAVVLGAAVGVAAAVAVAVERPALAAALVGLLVLLVFAAVVQLLLRLAEAARTSRLLLGEVRSVAASQASLADHIGALAGRVEAAERRIVAAVAEEGGAATGREREALAAVESSVLKAVKAAGDRLARNEWDQTREVEALMQLFRDFRPRAPMPSSGRWALNPTGLLELLFLVERKQPKLVLELGSGTSSVWLGYLLQRTGGRLVSVDHDPDYAERTRFLLRAHGLDEAAEVRLAPLRPLEIAGEAYQWYDASAFYDLSDVDLLAVDGPPGTVGPDARYPALHVLEGKLAAAASVVLDDADRPDEQRVVRRWTETVAGLARTPEILGQQAVLRYVRPTADG